VAFPTTTSLVAALRARKVSARELLDQAIARIEAGDVRLNAVVVRDFERARRAASAADAALARGEPGALLGVPMTVKESFNVAGLPTTWGLAAAAGRLAESDAVAVSRLKAAGSVILGKTNVSANLHDWQSVNPVYGRTANPWDTDRTPGGSSGGAAAALAAGFVPLELGSDLAGSLRVPAHCCGIYAHKPTHGLLPNRGHAPPGAPVLSVGLDADLAVIGPMARGAADLALALDVLAGPDDAPATAYRLELPAPRHARLADYRVLVLDEHPLLPTAAEVRALIERFAGDLKRAGCRVERSSPLLPDLTSVAETFVRLLMSFIGANTPEASYRAMQDRAAATATDAPDALMRRSLVGSYRDWMLAHRMRTFHLHQWRQLFRAWDIVVCPVLPVTAFAHTDAQMDERRIDVDGRALPYGLLAVWAGLASAGGLPSTALPLGLGSGGMPVGVQAIGPYLEDRSTIAFAELAEREFGGFTAPPAC
jgi:amidase